MWLSKRKGNENGSRRAVEVLSAHDLGGKPGGVDDFARGRGLAEIGDEHALREAKVADFCDDRGMDVHAVELEREGVMMEQRYVMTKKDKQTMRVHKREESAEFETMG